jgi:hypothetical protein
MAGKKRGLGKGLSEINAEVAASAPQLAADATRRDPFGVRSLIPNDKQLAAREADPDGYRIAVATFRSRMDGLDSLTPSGQALQNRLSRYGTDPDFGPGYEVINPAKTSGHGDARAQKIGYNRALQYLAIKMRDNHMIGYPGVDADTWERYQGYSSTHSYIYVELSSYNGGGWEDFGEYGSPPQTPDQNFEQGTQD